MQDEYVPPQAPSSSLDRKPAHSRRTSEQDIVLPSVEREMIDLTSPRRTVNAAPQSDSRPASRGYVTVQSPKRKTLPSFADGREQALQPELKRARPVFYEVDFQHRAGTARMSRPAHESDYQSFPTRSRPGPSSQQAVIDLTSPRQAPSNGHHGHYASSQGRMVAESSGFSYISVQSRRSPVYEGRAPHYEVHPGEQPRTYMSSSGMYERRAPPAHDYRPVQDAGYQAPVYEDGVRYPRSGQPYGGP